MPNPNIGPSEVWRFYYYAGSQRIAVRVTSSSQSQVYYLFSDHLGSLHLTVDPNGALHAGRRYYPFGAPRAVSPGSLETELAFTGQREQTEIGLFWIGSRWYDAALGRWVQPDTLIPDPYNPSSWDHYAYVLNDPMNAIDPSGHKEVECDGSGNCLDMRKLQSEYNRAEAWQAAGMNFDGFVVGYAAYQYYVNNPSEALQNCIDDTEEYFLADTYSEYVLHQAFQPFDEGPVMVMIEQARQEEDAPKLYGAWLWLGTGLFFEADKGYGGGGNSAQWHKLKPGEIKALKKAGIDIHGSKGNKRVSQFDLFKDGEGNVFMKPKSGIGPGEPLGINIKELFGK